MSDELSAALRELAADRARPPAVDGAAIRARATRRRRRRRATVTLGAGTLAVVVLGLVLNLNLGGEREHPPGSRVPAATYSTPPSTPTPTPTPAVGLLDLRGSTLTLGGRKLPILSQYGAPLELTSPLTVVAKRNPRELTFEVRSKGSAVVSVPYVVELRDGEGRPHYVGLYVPELKVLSDYDVQGGDLIALDTKEAQWFYDRIRVGDTISVATSPRQGTVPSSGVRTPDVTPTVPAQPRDAD